MSELVDMDAPVTRREMKELLKPYATREEMFAEMARLFRAMEESLRDTIRISLEPHHGVPERVTRLEAEELPPRVRALEQAGPPARGRRRTPAPKRGRRS